MTNDTFRILGKRKFTGRHVLSVFPSQGPQINLIHNNQFSQALLIFGLNKGWQVEA